MVGGLDVLSRIEQLPTDAEDRPIEPGLHITNALILVNPFENLESEMAEAQAREEDPKAYAAAEAAKKRAADSEAWYTTPAAQPTPLREGVGKYIAQKHLEQGAPAAGATASALAAAAAAGSSSLAAAAIDDEPQPKKLKKASGGFGNFSGW